MNTTADTNSAAADSAALRNERATSPDDWLKFPVHPSRLRTLRETLEAGAALPDEELKVFLEAFREKLLYENMPWMTAVVAGDLRDIGHEKYRIGWRHGLVWGAAVGCLVALVSVATGTYWAGA
jgi:hypothetical protein